MIIQRGSIISSGNSLKKILGIKFKPRAFLKSIELITNSISLDSKTNSNHELVEQSISILDDCIGFD